MYTNRKPTSTGNIFLILSQLFALLPRFSPLEQIVFLLSGKRKYLTGKGDMTTQVSLQTRKVTAQVTKQATAIVATYRESGAGSNRTNWVRTIALMGAVLTAIKSGDAVDVTDLFPASGAGKQYHVAHRALSSGAVRPYWNQVTVLVVKNATLTKGWVSGETTTTGSGSVFIVKAE